MLSYTKSVPIFASGRRVGTVRDGTFHKTVHGSRHFLRLPPGIAFSDETIEQAKALGAVSVQVFDLESKRTYTATLEHFEKHCFPVRRGYESQHGLRFSEFDITGGPQVGDANTALDHHVNRQGKKNGPEQLGLFG